MKLNGLSDISGATKMRKRVGRGIGSGTGKTAGRGVKGQKSRSGVALKGFEGGQMPIYRRLPKRGFNNIFSRDYSIISVGRIQDAINAGKLDADKVINAGILRDVRIIRSIKNGVRLLSDGKLVDKISLEISGASKLALSKVKKAGGSVKFL